MENTTHAIPTEPQLAPVPDGVQYSKEHADALRTGKLKVGMFCAAAVLINLLDMGKGDILALGNQAEAVPVVADSSVSQVNEAYVNGDVLNNIPDGTVVSEQSSEITTEEHQSQEKDDKHTKSSEGLLDLLDQDTARFAEVERDLNSEPEPVPLPDDFPIKKLPISITLETPADALRKQPVNH
jgi:hypothetical protein